MPLLGIEIPTLPTSLEVLQCPTQEFLCPISLDIMIDPVLLLPTGQIYDYHSLVRWFESGQLPLTSLFSSVRLRSITPSAMHCWMCSFWSSTLCALSCT